MLTAHRRLFALSLPFLAADTGTPVGGGGGTESTEEPPTPASRPAPLTKPTFDDSQQQFINDLVARERKAAEDRVEQRLRDEADKAAADAAAKRQRDEAESRGEFETVRADLETRVASTEGERDALASEVSALRTYFDAEFAAAVKDLPDVITAFKPADGASFAEKSAWLVTAREQAAKVAKRTGGGNPPNPPVGDGKIDVTAEVAKARASGRYRG